MRKLSLAACLAGALWLLGADGLRGQRCGLAFDGGLIYAPADLDGDHWRSSAGSAWSLGVGHTWCGEGRWSRGVHLATTPWPAASNVLGLSVQGELGYRLSTHDDNGGGWRTLLRGGPTWDVLAGYNLVLVRHWNGRDWVKEPTDRVGLRVDTGVSWGRRFGPGAVFLEALVSLSVFSKVDDTGLIAWFRLPMAVGYSFGF